MNLFRTRAGWMVDTPKGRFTLPAEPEGALTTREDLPEYLAALALTSRESAGDRSAQAELLAPLETQEVWAAGVTYKRSKAARMEESKAASGSSFYDLVYNAERPELFFKAAPWRVVGSGGTARIRRDARWSVPEPELVLLDVLLPDLDAFATPAVPEQATASPEDAPAFASVLEEIFAHQEELRASGRGVPRQRSSG